MPMPVQFGERYVLTQPLGATTVARQKGNSSFTQIPTGATIEIEAEMDHSGMVAIDWQRQSYQVFEADIIGKCSKLSATVPKDLGDNRADCTGDRLDGQKL